MKHIFFWAFAFCAACTDTPASPQRAAECYVRYLAPEGQLLAEVTLREAQAGKPGLQPVEAAEGVRYNGTLMRAVSGRGLRYQLEQPTGYNYRHVFNWKTDLQPVDFQVDLPPIVHFSFGPGPLSRQRAQTLAWTGAPMDTGESLVLMWESIDGNRTVPMEIRTTPGQKTIEFPAAQLGNLQPGVWTLYLVRKKRVKTVQNGTTLYGLAEYYTTVDTLTVE